MKEPGPESAEGGIKALSWSWPVSHSAGWDAEWPEQQVQINWQWLVTDLWMRMTGCWEAGSYRDRTYGHPLHRTGHCFPCCNSWGDFIH